MNDLKSALYKAAKDNPDFKKILDQAEVNNKKKTTQLKKEKEEREKELQKEKEEKEAQLKAKRSEENRKKKIYVWRTNVCGMHYSVRSGIVFANDIEAAKKIVQETYARDTITFIDLADISDEVVETCLYIE